jgi:hypothetical protein
MKGVVGIKSYKYYFILSIDMLSMRASLLLDIATEGELVCADYLFARDLSALSIETLVRLHNS